MRKPIGCDVVLEQTLGHVTHSQNLQRLLPLVPDLEPRFVPIAFETDGWIRHVPGWSNWTVRAGVRAHHRIAAAWRRGGRPDVMFVHTQVPAVLLRRPMRRVPTVVSLDATPVQYDSLGAHYTHEVGSPRVEHAKHELNRRCFARAAHLITWAHWTKRSLVDDYGVAPERITVIPPGVDTGRWLIDDATATRRDADSVVRFLFVGGDLRRKGGDQLLCAFAPLHAEFGAGVELHLVTPSPVEPTEGVFVHASMTPNSPDLIALYHRCHVFCLPTLGDCLPMVLPEAGAAGLALIATDVGAISEIVHDHETGLLVPVDSVEALRAALHRLATDAEMRRRLANRASELVVSDHDAVTNATRIGDVLRSVAG